jgi:bacterial/archaeal transporter family-2 protein
MTALLLLVALLAGACVALQVGSNAHLKEATGEPLSAVVFNSLIGILLLAGAIVVTRPPLPALSQLSTAPPAAWLGGLFGAAYAVVTILLARRLGAATLIAAAVTGQLICAVILDHFGWMGFEVHPISVWRMVGCVLLLAGLALIWRL